MVSDQFSPTRRALLASGVATTAALAGCFGGQDDDGDGGDGGGDGGDGDGGQAAASQGEAGRLVYTQEIRPDGDFDPIVTFDAYSAQINSQVYDGLYEYDFDLQPQPKLAAGEPEVERDGQRYIVELVEGAQFHNGDPVTAEDVVHTFTAPIEEETENLPTYEMVDVEGTEAIDERTAQIDLEFPYGAFAEIQLASTIVNAEVRQEDPDAYNTDPIGSGPFTFEEYAPDEYIELARWDDYWDEPVPELESVRFEAAEDDAGRVSQILAGDTDAIATVPPADWDQIDAEEGIETYRAESPSYMYVAFNCNEGGTTDPDVRRGVSHAFSVTEFVDANLGESAIPLSTPIPPIVDGLGWDFPMEEWNEAAPSYDPERAQELLDGAAPSGWNPTIIVPPDDVRIALGELIAARLNELGYEAQVQSLDFATLGETYTTGNADDYEMYILGWTGGPDPDVYLYNLFHEDNAGISQGHYYQGSEDFHDNILQARQTADQEERRELYTDVIDEIVEQVPVRPVYSPYNTMAAQSYVQDLQAHPAVAYNPRLVSEDNNVSVE
ncbi:ABC transporter substrate-binding protein [Salinilacihabitans rarus]|uniref:ABC transporter substrate-binding protein n=1 Tax=Salinilacihabitans rarus TaxID=2961596 RepID=UPI0020C8ADDC|nr:ABC transporter substrate-binding protein [Salinilacihabitans rarus]